MRSHCGANAAANHRSNRAAHGSADRAKASVNRATNFDANNTAVANAPIGPNIRNGV